MREEKQAPSVFEICSIDIRQQLTRETKYSPGARKIITKTVLKHIMITLSSNPYFACIAAMSVYTERCIHIAQYNV
jgi:hypothetical protein